MTVRIAPAQGSIVEVGSEAVRFTDAEGNSGVANLRPLRPESRKIVGEHNLKETPCWVQLDGVRFEFETRKSAYEELVDPMLRLDRHTRKGRRFARSEGKLLIPADSRWNHALLAVAICLVVLTGLLAVLTDQWWAIWLAVAALLRAAYDGVVHLKKKWDGKSGVL
ncbi:hypothetical protein B1759_16590 [Rubrivirga sp. SAORIC476]|uniref:hypothetical protein n=1 Tax=Rubrivirga sp. SAORIC476 TaxID=1961794 RepID=UPI000BA90E69|nr:hypothetical protein [Rubrivirga sp. SAORIC476]PAP74796.1 hypothetical protein B1759_16590 [Rubrivirga sp. SAORIC476]